MDYCEKLQYSTRQGLFPVTPLWGRSVCFENQNCEKDSFCALRPESAAARIVLYKGADSQGVPCVRQGTSARQPEPEGVRKVGCQAPEVSPVAVEAGLYRRSGLQQVEGMLRLQVHTQVWISEPEQIDFINREVGFLFVVLWW